jgi:hypothetical protein
MSQSDLPVKGEPSRSAFGVTFVKGLFASRDLPEQVRRRVELAVAVAQERLVSTHVKHALRLVQVAGDQMPFLNVLNMYSRVLRLSDDDARVVISRALATIGEEAARSDHWPEPPTEDAEEEPTGGRRWLMRLVRERLRGRVNEDLRKWVDFAAARAEVAILDTHIENALTFVELLEREMPVTDAAEVYLDSLRVRDSLSEVVYFSVLARLADQHLPGKLVNPEQHSAAEPKLRVLDRDGTL